MRELYELTTLAFPLLSAPLVAKAAQDWVTMPGATGTWMGYWRTEIGPLGRMLILRRFEDAGTLQRERQRALSSANPFNAGGVVTALEMDSYMPFPFLPPARVTNDAIFEFRTYKLKPGGLPATLKGWEAAITPAKDYTAHLVINMYSLDGPPRITHIWGFDSLAQRTSLRSSAYAAGCWPPKGGPENILEAMSVIALPESV